jgi:hypothetical protein
MFPILCIVLGKGQTKELWHTSKFCLKESFSQTEWEFKQGRQEIDVDIVERTEQTTGTI